LFHQHASDFWLLLAALLVLLLLWQMWTAIRQRRFRRRMERLFGRVSQGNIPAMLAAYLETAQSISHRQKDMERRVLELSEALPSMVRNMGLIRFTPFNDTGGNHSFCLALLDGKGDGVVLTALHSRRDSKLYAKPVINGASPLQLTEEERQAITQSFQSEPVERAVG
jgi:hypothetical protein